ncbi:LIM and calponin homology domains-containing protein 1 isoform X1 [Ictalurus furcatus]|uniref:LIM and calponin homology domains-containing protein 1 isoform X1 n=1 Tax=Ictalurus furcatus TaxID=66913 RepID=UPI002350DBC6|nr:LIM and calponin homology domains-containing protein 1 isoform X1 [Ictalurus furcatus]
MASPGSDARRQLHPQHPHSEAAPEPAVREARKWIKAVTGRSFGEDFRGSLDNGILLCELLSSIKPGLVKKINRLPTPLASQDNLVLFLKGCEELGLKGSQLFDPGDLQDTRTTRGSDCNKRLKNVLITIYWLGRAANSSATYNGPTLDLHEFEGLLSQMRKEVEDWDSPKRSIRDSGYIDYWESERSDSLSPPRHARDDSFDSLDSIGSRSRHTPSPDGLFARSSSDGRGSDSECDIPYRKLPDMRRDDMLARRTSCSEPRTAVPFNQYLPNKSNQTSYVHIPLRRQRTEREESCKSWSNATSPVGGERSFRFGRSDSVFDDPESMSMIDVRTDDDGLLPPHSQVRHELMHGQYTRMKEEDSQWQDDLARWKSRRRSVSQDLIKKEEERKTMERLLSRDEGSQRRKSFKTYREIVEDKERRERELHEAYLKARTPEEAAAVLQRYALRFTISEAVLERLKLPRVLERSISADPTRSSSLSNDPVFSSSSSSSPSSSSNPLQYLRQQSLPAQKFTTTVQARVTGYGAEDVAVGREGGGSGAACSSRSIPLLSAKPYSHDRAAKQDEMERVNGETDNDHNAGDEREWRIETEREDGDQREHTGDSSPLLFYPSPSQNVDSDSTEIEVSDSLSSDKQAISHTLTHTPELDAADFVSVEGRSVVPGPERQEEEDTQKEGALSQPTSLPTQTQPEEEAVPQSRSIPPTQKQKEYQTEENEKCPEDHPVESSDPDSVRQTEQDTRASSHINVTDNQVSKPVPEPSERTANPPAPSSLDRPTPKFITGLPITELADSAQLATLSSNPKLRWDFFTSPEPVEKHDGNVAPTVLNLVQRGERFSWDPEEERKRQERWQQEQERMLQLKYQREQQRLKQEWERAQKEVEEEERRYHEEERRILEETAAPLTPNSPLASSPCFKESSHTQNSIVRDWEREQVRLEKQMMETLENARKMENGRKEATRTKEEHSQTSERPQKPSCDQIQAQPNGQRGGGAEGPNQVPKQPHTSQDASWSSKQHQQRPSSDPWQKPASQDTNRNIQPAPGSRRRSGSIENAGAKSSQSISHTDTQQPPSPNRSVSGKKLCSSCGHPLGKGAAMIIETLSLYFHIQCFKCGVCKGQLGDTSTGTDVRIRNGLLNCHQCYIRSRSAGQPTNL